MLELNQQKCVPCTNATARLDQIAAQQLLTQLQGWQLNAAATQLSKVFNFKNFYQTIAFVNAVAWLAQQENHHPNLEVSYKQCKILYSTHSVAGLSNNDFICAAKIEHLF